MTIGFDRDISNRIVTSVVSIKEFGTGSVSESAERENLDDYPQVLKYGDIDFTGKFTMDTENHIPVLVEENAEASGEEGSEETTEETSADTITLDLGDSEFTINADFTASYSVDAKTLTRKLQSMTVIPDEDCLAMAMVMLWEKKVGDKIKTLIEASRVHMNGFADEVVEITI